MQKDIAAIRVDRRLGMFSHVEHVRNIAASRMDRRFGLFLHDENVKKYRRLTNGLKFLDISSWFDM